MRLSELINELLQRNEAWHNETLMPNPEIIIDNKTIIGITYDYDKIILEID